MPEAPLDISLMLLDCGMRHDEGAPEHSRGFQEVVETLFKVFYIVPKIFESVHKIRLYVRRWLLSLAETR